MRSYAVAVLALAASVVAQGVPQCAQPCIGSSFGSCASLDVNCICSSRDLIAGLACCVSTACTPDEQVEVINFANALCADSGADLPESATCAPGVTPTNAAQTSTGSASGSTITSAPSNSTVTDAPTGSTNGTTAAETDTTTTAAGTTRTTTGTGSGTAGGATTPTSSGAAATLGAAFGAGALFFGALAAL